MNTTQVISSGTALLDVCALDDIPVLGARRVRRDDGVEIAVFRTGDDQVFALLDRCPHKGGPLSQGIVFGKSVACPLHNWTIDLEDGRAAAPDQGCVVRFPVCVIDGRVLLDPFNAPRGAADAERTAA